ncbi:MAG: bifunctional methylenetetrahydrofolate dehydrogenase/methenyltetrahydrofolate cyclohydrolase FolD [Betaproteobacteria bacterium]|nr:bifunctional methylenetetrahydrofolate dehydrogenase/methenyltetrahydrofolate cyclohydrolase FolD [Gammaproteobacteria bacterium]MDH3437197.1 bifunctional methylenetetrahydrofolate dehydrogenase/methenyltetrahydrofolate cyclohydrolase FolD [Betaproteobacteria bacterium]
MAAIVLDGTAAAREVYAGLKERVAGLARANLRPGLAAVLVGDNPASKIYIRNKVRACAEAGIHSEVHALPAASSSSELVATLARLNDDPDVHGILVQLPLPGHLDETLVARTVAAQKDVDGLTWQNLGALMAGHPGFEPCTPRGVMMLLDRTGVPVEGQQAVVVGRSTIVGKPMALMLTARSATVTVCHSRTADLGRHTRRADILVAATGRAGLITADMVKPGAAVFDVGINRSAGGITGDVDFAAAKDVAGWITPVPGGVGPMTIAMVIANTVQAAERNAAGPGA